MIVPYFHPQFGWVVAAYSLSQINTWLVIGRRFWRRSNVYLSISFYISWMLVCICLYPFLICAFAMEYFKILFNQLDVDRDGGLSPDEMLQMKNWFNCVLPLPFLQFALTLLNFKWTFD